MEMAKALTFLSCVAALVLLPKVVAAAESPAVHPPEFLFGNPGTVVLDRLVSFNAAVAGPNRLAGESQVGFLRFSRGKTSVGGMAATTTTFQIAPSFDVFANRRVTLGGELGIAYERAESELGLSVGAAVRERYSATILPRVGYYLPISTEVAFWPRLSVGGTFGRASGGVVNAERLGKLSSFSMLAALDLDLAVGLGKHLSVLVGPRVAYSVGRTGSDVDTSNIDVSGRAALAFAF